MHTLRITSFLVTIFFLSFLHITNTSYISAQGENKKEPITYEELLALFEKNEVVEDRVIDGNNIIRIIGETDYDIKIKNSIIKGGLNFHLLPDVSVDEVDLSKKLSEKEQKMFREKHYYSKFYIVTNRIEIASSEIQGFRSVGLNEILSERDEYSVSIDAGDTFFYKDVDFSGATFTEKVNFFGATFTGEADFNDTIFTGEAYFLFATFTGYADFSAAIYTKNANFTESIFSRFAYFSDATFIDEADFSAATFTDYANFSGGTFSGSAYFLKTRIETLDLNLAIFEKIADFRDSSIKRLNFLNYSPNIIQGRIDFRNAVISGAHFQNLIFEKDVDFSDVQFGNTNSDGAVIFRFITFESEAYFIRTIFSSDTEFQRINFKKDVNFTNAVFKTEGGNLKQRFSLSYLNFTKLLISWNQLPKPDIWLREKDEDKIKSFIDIDIDIDIEREKIWAGFSKDEFMLPFKISNLCRAIKDDNYELGQKPPNESIEWLNSILEIPNFYDIVSKKKNFKDTNRVSDFVEKTNESRKKIFENLNYEEQFKIKKLNRIVLEEAYPQETPKFLIKEKREPLYQVFENLETTFRNQKKLSDANQAYYHKKREELRDIRMKGQLSWSRIGKEAEWFFWGLPCGYAMKIGRICIVSGSIYLFFALLFSAGGRLKKTETKEKQEFVIKPRLFDFPSKTIEEIREKNEKESQFVNALVYSLFTLFKIGYRDRRISKEIFKINAQYFIWTEWIIGYWMLATITMTIYNTVPVINRLISGVF